MSKQLALSAAFSIFMMATFVLFGADAAREPLGFEAPAVTAGVEISMPEMPQASALLPALR
jgi:hypothetical protein